MPTTNIRGLRMYYELSGQGHPVVFISGITLDHSIWKAFQVPEFTAAGFSCLVFDNRDVGQTGESPTGPYAIGQFVDDTVGLLDQLGLESPHIVGYSMGGMIAQELALKLPNRARSLTLLATVPKLDAYGKALIESLKAAKRNLAPAEFSWTLGLRAFTYRFFNNPDAVKMWMDRVIANPYPQSVAGFIRQADAAIAHDTLSRLARITMPTHVIVGEEDMLTPPRHARTLAGGISGAVLTTISEGGHALPTEKAAEFNRVALGFLAQH